MFGNVRWVFICFVLSSFFPASKPYCCLLYQRHILLILHFMHKQSSNFFLDILNNRGRSLSVPQNRKKKQNGIVKFFLFYYVFQCKTTNTEGKKKQINQQNIVVFLLCSLAPLLFLPSCQCTGIKKITTKIMSNKFLRLLTRNPQWYFITIGYGEIITHNINWCAAKKHCEPRTKNKFEIKFYYTTMIFTYTVLTLYISVLTWMFYWTVCL